MAAATAKIPRVLIALVPSISSPDHPGSHILPTISKSVQMIIASAPGNVAPDGRSWTQKSRTDTGFSRRIKRSVETPIPGNVVSSKFACAAAGGGEGFTAPQKDRHTRMPWRSKCSQKWVWTVSTPWASDSVVPVSDWAGLGMFSGEWRILKGSSWFESHLGHVFSMFRGFLASECARNVHFVGPFGGLFSLLAGAMAGCLLPCRDGRFVVRYHFMGVHGTAT